MAPSVQELPDLKPYGRPGSPRGSADLLKAAQDALQICKDMDRANGGKVKNKVADLAALITNSQGREAFRESMQLLRAVLPPALEWRFIACAAELEADATEVLESTVLHAPRVFMYLQRPTLAATCKVVGTGWHGQTQFVSNQAQTFGATASQRKHLREMWRILDESIACSRDVEDHALQGEALHTLAWYHVIKDDPKATKIAQDALAIFRFMKDVPNQYKVLGTLCDAFLSKGRMNEAAEAAKEMRSKCGLKDHKSKAEALLMVAKAAMGQEEYDLAEEMAEEALGVYRLNLKDKYGQQRALESLLGTRLMNEGNDEAYECSKELLHLWQGRDGSKAMEAMAMQVVAHMQIFQETFVSHFLREKGRSPESLKMGQALVTAKEALEKYREVADDRHVVASMLATLQQAHAVIQNYQEALETTRRIQVIYNELDDRLSEAGALLDVAEAWFTRILFDVNRDFRAAVDQHGEEKAKEVARDSIPQDDVDSATKVALDAQKLYAELKCTVGEEAVAACVERFNVRGLDFHRLIYPPTATYYIMSEDRKTFKVQHEWSFAGEGNGEPHKPILKETVLPPEIQV